VKELLDKEIEEMPTKAKKTKKGGKKRK